MKLKTIFCENIKGKYGMNDIRKELERNLKASAKENLEQSPEIAPETAMAEPQETIVEETMVIAPKSYRKQFAEDFKNLSPEWQNFLLERESQIEKGFSEINNKVNSYKALEDLFKQNYERLSPCFEKAKDWLEGLAKVDAEMDKNPLRTIKAIADYYGIKIEFPNHRNIRANSEIIERLEQLELGFNALQNHFKQEKSARFAQEIESFGKKCDENGCLLHPFYAEVKEQMAEMLAKGVVESFDEAYAIAIWLNPNTREKLIGKQIEERASQAQKAQEAAFAPKGKAVAPTKVLSLREELEKNMAKFKI